MCFLMKIFCFLLVLNYVTSKNLYELKNENFSDLIRENFVEFTFNAMPLGHSGLLIFWKPNITTQSERITSICFFKFNCTVAENNIQNSKFDDSQNLESGGKNTIDSEAKETRISSSGGQYKIHSLKENTLYNVTIKQSWYSNRENVLKEYSVEVRTNLKTERIPAKSYFEYTQDNNNRNLFTLRWYPCGRERICNGEESGTHFGITVKEPYNTRKLSEVTREELYSDNIEVVFWPGILYEVILYSVNGGYKTESDSREIFVNPGSTPVRYVNIISLPNLSILISWKPPKEFLGESLRGVCVYYFNLSNPNGDITDQAVLFKDFKKFKKHANFAESPSEQTRIFGLIPEVMYTYVLFPVSQHGFGFPYRIKYTLQVYNQDLPIAKPDFNYIQISERSSSDAEDKKCEFCFQWLPCGKLFDCGTSKPGSNYSFQIRPEPLSEMYEYMHEHGYYAGYFGITEIYTVTLTSSIGNNLSEPVTKMFKNCDEIRDEL